MMWAPTGPTRRVSCPSTIRNVSPWVGPLADVEAAVRHPGPRRPDEEVLGADRHGALARRSQPLLQRGGERRLAGTRRAVEHEHPHGKDGRAWTRAPTPRL